MKLVDIVMTVVTLTLATLLLVQMRDTHQQQNAHRDYVRRVELELAEIKGRLATLERIGIRIDLMDHTGLWFVPKVTQEVADGGERGSNKLVNKETAHAEMDL